MVYAERYPASCSRIENFGRIFQRLGSENIKMAPTSLAPDLQFNPGPGDEELGFEATFFCSAKLHNNTHGPRAARLDKSCSSSQPGTTPRQASPSAARSGALPYDSHSLLLFLCAAELGLEVPKTILHLSYFYTVGLLCSNPSVSIWRSLGELN